MFRLGRDASQGDKHLAFQPIFRGPKHALAELAKTQMLPIRQDTDALHRPAQYQGDRGMAGFVVGGGFVVGRFHAVQFSEMALAVPNRGSLCYGERQRKATLIPNACEMPMSGRQNQTLADYVVLALSPALIMGLVASLVFFLLNVLYVGEYVERLRWILFFFVFGAVLSRA